MSTIFRELKFWFESFLFVNFFKFLFFSGFSFKNFSSLIAFQRNRFLQLLDIRQLVFFLGSGFPVFQFSGFPVFRFSGFPGSALGGLSEHLELGGEEVVDGEDDNLWVDLR